MAAEDFFSRWSKKNAETRTAMKDEPADASLPEFRAPAAPVEKDKKLPTMEDVAHLTPEADFSAFMARGVDETVKRAAVKKLFSDPHFNVMDGLDVYIDDYNSFEALTPDILASLNHAKALLDPLAQCSAPTMKLLDMLDDDPATEDGIASNDAIASAPQPGERQGTTDSQPTAERASQTENAPNRDSGSDENETVSSPQP